MQGETNIFLRGLRAAPAPWQHKSVNLGLPNRRDEIVDYEGRNIIDFALPGGGYTIEEYRNTLALVELVYNQRELLGAVPEPALLELILQCGGPDLTQHKTIHEQTTVVEPEAQPPAANERLLG